MKKKNKSDFWKWFRLGIASIFRPSLIEVEYLEMPSEKPSDALASIWREVGAYISSAYESRPK